ncbi:MAG: DUF3137 domain-containing protein, partial [Oscillospiraceae bacterium]|nr:DUF3137 domain-containing protein [Oscillospiraceae bacterium]
MDNVEFEKNFFVGSNEQITAMQYLTADIMDLLLNFQKLQIEIFQKIPRRSMWDHPNRMNMDLLWEGNSVLMRIGNRKMFKPTLRDPMCKESLKLCLSALDFALKFNAMISKSIKDTEI